MINPKTPVQNALLTYMIFVLILLYTKPKFLFKSNGELKSFGCDINKTLINFPMIVIGFGILFYFIFATLNILHQ